MILLPLLVHPILLYTVGRRIEIAQRGKNLGEFDPVGSAPDRSVRGRPE
jgi:hypothetical protein